MLQFYAAPQTEDPYSRSVGLLLKRNFMCRGLCLRNLRYAHVEREREDIWNNSDNCFTHMV